MARNILPIEIGGFHTPDQTVPIVFKSGQKVLPQAHCDGCKQLVPAKEVKAVTVPPCRRMELRCKACR